jgi:outer membrane immunogenic protein
MRSSKLIVSAAVAISTVAGIGAASAADLPARTYTKAPAMVDPSYNWSGFYIGGNVGGGWSNTRFDAIPGGDHFLLAGQSVSTGNSNGNVVGGGQIGYNWQFQQIVLGLEGTYSGSAVRNDTGIFPSAVFGGEAARLNSKITQYGTIVGRLGFAPTNDWLLYGKGGYAVGRIETNPQDFFPLPATLQHFSNAGAWQDGYTAGVGVEYKWANHWVFGVEYDYLRFSSQNQSNTFISTTGLPVGPPTFYSQNVRADLSTVTARLSYLFNASR